MSKCWVLLQASWQYLVCICLASMSVMLCCLPESLCFGLVDVNPLRLSSASANSSWSQENHSRKWNKSGWLYLATVGWPWQKYHCHMLQDEASCSLLILEAQPVTREHFPTVSEPCSYSSCGSEAHTLPSQPMFGFPVVGFYRAVLYWIYHASC